jgi:hypothetical protein
MFLVKRLVQSLAAAALCCGLSHSAQAQVGTGWTSTSYSYSIQTSSGCSVSGNTFSVGSGTSGRAERRYANITSSQAQMQGTVVVNSLGGDRVSLSQIHEINSATSLVAIKKPGTLYEVEGGATVGPLAIGASTRINMTVVSSTGKCQTYQNGSLKTTVTGGGGTFYFKVGAYITGSGSGPATVTWTGVQFWKK